MHTIVKRGVLGLLVLTCLLGVSALVYAVTGDKKVEAPAADKQQAVNKDAAKKPDQQKASSQKIGDWTHISKGKEKGDGKISFLAQDLIQAGKKGRVLRVLVGPFGDKGEMVLKAVVPLGIYLPAGVAYKVDDREQAPMVIQRCTKNGCEAAIMLAGKNLDEFSNGNKMLVGFSAGPEAKTMSVEVSLKGTAKGLEALKKQ